MIRRFFFLVLLVSISFAGHAQTFAEAISKKDSVAALALLKSGTDINAVDANGTSQLMNASRWADDWGVSFLLRHGANADNPKSPKGRTSLMIACAYYSGFGICKMLID